MPWSLKHLDEFLCDFPFKIKFLLQISDFSIFQLMIFILSLIVNFHDNMIFTTLVHSTCLMFSHDLVFMSTCILLGLLANTCIHMFWVLTSCICPLCPNYRLYIYILEPCAFMHTLLWTLYVWDMYVYFSLYMTYICLEVWIIVMIFMFDYDSHVLWWFQLISWCIYVSYLDDFHFELNYQFSWWYVFHNTCTLNLLDVFPWFNFLFGIMT